MGRHSAPDDSDVDVIDVDAAEADARMAQDATGGADTTPGTGRHSRHDGSRPRPPSTGAAADTAAVEPQLDATASPAVEGLGLLDDVLAEPSSNPVVVVDAETAEAVVLEPIDEPLAPDPAPTEPATTEPATTEPATTKPAHSTRHDLALVKDHGDVRARVVAAVLVPFVVYVVVLAVIGELTVHNLVWVWAPAVAAGVLVGLVLDAGHRRYPTTVEPRPAPVAGADSAR